MKKLFFIIISVLTFVGCTSKEQKANSLIKEFLTSTMIQPETYTPIKTEVTEAYLNPYTDVNFIKSVEMLMGLEEEKAIIDKHLKTLTDAANIPRWGDNQNALHYEFLPGFENNPLRQEIISAAEESDALGNKIDMEKQYLLISLPTSNEKIGWKVYHQFKHKNLNGDEIIEDYYFVIDNKFKNISLVQNLNNENCQKITEYIRRHYDSSNE